MILQSLAGLYERLSDDTDSTIAPPGFQRQEILFVIVLDAHGNCVGIDDTRSGEGMKKRGRTFIVPRVQKRSGKNAWQVANLLWDNLAYTVGYSDNDAETARKKKEAFLGRIDAEFGDDTDDEGILAVREFLKSDHVAKMSNLTIWKEIVDSTGSLSFRLTSDQSLICNRPTIVNHIKKSVQLRDGDKMHCLISGEDEAAARLHSPIKGVWGAHTSGADLVSYNLGAFTSFEKTQGFNAPIGQTAEFAYTTALNTLLARGSRQRIQVGDATTVFWSERRSDLENSFADLFDPPKDNPSAGTDAVEALFAAPRTGALPSSEGTNRFFVLGLAPNAKRLAVRFWYARTVAEVEGAMRQHFEDISIVHAPHAQKYPPLWKLLASTVLKGESKNLPPNLAGDVMKAVLEGTPYPHTLLAAAIRRIRAERSVTYERAAIMKAVLLRQARRTNSKEVSVMLDREETNVGYRLGRLFALLERCQEAVSPGLNATISDRFFGSASGTPVVAFPILIRLNRNHLKKLKQEKPGYAVNLEKEIGEIMDGIENRFPPHLDLDGQGRFAIGYYHQRQDFFKKKDRKENEEEKA